MPREKLNLKQHYTEEEMKALIESVPSKGKFLSEMKKRPSFKEGDIITNLKISDDKEGDSLGNPNLISPENLLPPKERELKHKGSMTLQTNEDQMKAFGEKFRSIPEPTRKKMQEVIIEPQIKDLTKKFKLPELLKLHIDIVGRGPSEEIKKALLELGRNDNAKKSDHLKELLSREIMNVFFDPLYFLTPTSEQ